MRHEVSAGGIIVNSKNQILMIEDQWDKWTFPKGHIERGETAEQTALREVKEEVGLKTEIIKKLLTDEYWFVANWEKGKPKVHKTVHWFLMCAEGKPQPQTAEIKNARWFNISEIDKLETYENTQKLVSELVSELVS